MRLWSLNPVLLDPKGLVALWREGLLAKNVLMNKTKGYKFHPQLERFKKTDDPVASIDLYLSYVLKEATKRGYSFDASKLQAQGIELNIEVTTGQMAYELEHLRNKLKHRNFVFLEKLPTKLDVCVHPIFQLIPGEIEYWERILCSNCHAAITRYGSCPHKSVLHLDDFVV